MIWLWACTGGPEPTDSAPMADDTATEQLDSSSDSDPPSDTAPPDSDPPDCAASAEIVLDADPVPGTIVTVTLETTGNVTGWTWAPVDGMTEAAGVLTWVVPTDLAVHLDEVVTLAATVEVEACPSFEVETTVTVGHPDTNRVVVVYNPSADGSEAVARAYADFRGLDEGQLCGIASEATTTLDGADAAAWLGELQACIDGWGAWTWYVVPTWGVPYKVSGLIDDIGYGHKVTTSLDALMVFGAEGAGYDTAIYNPAYQDGDSMAGTYDPYVPFGELRAGWSYAMYLVTRLDGLDADAAIDLVERTRAAEEAELAGIVYVDGRYGDSAPSSDDFGSYEYGEWNMWGTRSLFEELGVYEVVWDGQSAEFGTAPAPTSCPDALYYAGWYSYYNYNDCFDWNVGAIGGHLDSCSACDLRATTTWAGGALADGITATFGAVAEPYVAGMPEYDQFFRYLTEGASYGEAAYESTVVGVWMMTWVGDPLYRPYPDELAPSE